MEFFPNYFSCALRAGGLLLDDGDDVMNSRKEKIQEEIRRMLARNLQNVLVDRSRITSMAEICAEIAEEIFGTLTDSSLAMLQDPRLIESVASAELEEGYYWKVGRTIPEGIITRIEIYPEEIGGQIYPWIRVLIEDQVVKRVAASSFIIHYFMPRAETMEEQITKGTKFIAEEEEK